MRGATGRVEKATMPRSTLKNGLDVQRLHSLCYFIFQVLVIEHKCRMDFWLNVMCHVVLSKGDNLLYLTSKDSPTHKRVLNDIESRKSLCHVTARWRPEPLGFWHEWALVQFFLAITFPQRLGMSFLKSTYAFRLSSRLHNRPFFYIDNRYVNSVY